MSQTVQISADKAGAKQLLEKMSHLRTNRADKYHIFLNTVNTKFKSNRKQILNIVRLECYVCYDNRRVQKDDSFYYVYPCFSDSSYISAKFSIVCLKKNAPIKLTPMFFQSIIDYCTENKWNPIMIQELIYLSTIFKPDDYIKVQTNIYTRPDGLHQIAIDCSKVFAQLFSEQCQTNYAV